VKINPGILRARSGGSYLSRQIEYQDGDDHFTRKKLFGSELYCQKEVFGMEKYCAKEKFGAELYMHEEE